MMRSTLRGVRSLRPCGAPKRRAFSEGAKKVNACYTPGNDIKKVELMDPESNASGAVSDAHWEAEWPTAKTRECIEEHVMFTWGAGQNYVNNPIITHGEGVYIYDETGKQYIDWTSQASHRQ